MKIRSLFNALLYLLPISALSTPPAEEGKVLFSGRCAACHNVNKTLTGPALAGIDQRRSMDWIVSFVQSSQTMIQNGDKDAVALFAQFNKIPMPDHRDLTKADIENIAEYIKSAAATTTISEAPFKRPGKLRPAYVPVSFSKDFTFFVALFSVIALLIIVLLFWVNVKEIERNRNNPSSTV